MSKRNKEPQVRVGDLVALDLMYSGTPRKRNFTARVVKVTPYPARPTVIDYERTDGFVDEVDAKHGIPSMCAVSYITKIIKPAPYICAPKAQVNLFAGERYVGYIVKQGGLRSGRFEHLVVEALATVRHINLEYPLHDVRSLELFKRASYPGRVALAAYDENCHWIRPDTTVRWKIFKAWVHRNAHLLVMSKTEYLSKAREFQESLDREMTEDYRRDMEDEGGWFG